MDVNRIFGLFWDEKNPKVGTSISENPANLKKVREHTLQQKKLTYGKAKENMKAVFPLVTW